MPNSKPLRTRILEAQQSAQSRPQLVGEAFVSDARAGLSPKQFVESKFFHALARVERSQFAPRKPR